MNKARRHRVRRMGLSPCGFIRGRQTAWAKAHPTGCWHWAEPRSARPPSIGPVCNRNSLGSRLRGNDKGGRLIRFHIQKVMRRKRHG